MRTLAAKKKSTRPRHGKHCWIVKTIWSLNALSGTPTHNVGDPPYGVSTASSCNNGKQKMSSTTTKSPIRLFNPPGLYDASVNGYSHVGLVPAGVRLVFVAGQGGEDVQGALDPDFRLQVRQALANLRTALGAAGADTSDIVKLTVLIVDHSEERLHIFGAEMEAALGEGAKPTCTLIPVPRLALDGMLFEIEAVAALG